MHVFCGQPSGDSHASTARVTVRAPITVDCPNQGADLAGCPAVAAQVRGSEGSRGRIDRWGGQGHCAAIGPGRRAGHGTRQGPAGRGKSPPARPRPFKKRCLRQARSCGTRTDTHARAACMIVAEPASGRAARHRQRLYPPLLVIRERLAGSQHCCSHHQPTATGSAHASCPALCRASAWRPAGRALKVASSSRCPCAGDRLWRCPVPAAASPSPGRTSRSTWASLKR